MSDWSVRNPALILDPIGGRMDALSWLDQPRRVAKDSTPWHGRQPTVDRWGTE